MNNENIIQKGTTISCGDYVGIALGEPVTIFSLKHLSHTPVTIDDSWSHIYLDTFYNLLDGGFVVTQRSFPNSWWEEKLFPAIFGNKKSLILIRESSIVNHNSIPQQQS